ncbi:hypothetical protein [Rhodoligotrophos defluvii]|uniref:hypothetical protein n=1 Tax=Rhodoligotrophos defluvii TaxID=2561934 RepID=UPI0010C979DE|nr:hypothetical protein [Rhodoligotrophos defluvii]
MTLRIMLGGIASLLVLAAAPVAAQQQQPGVVYDDGEPHAAPGSGITGQENAEEKDLSKDNNAASDYDPEDEEGPGSVVKRDPTEAEGSGTEGEPTD